MMVIRVAVDSAIELQLIFEHLYVAIMLTFNMVLTYYTSSVLTRCCCFLQCPDIVPWFRIVPRHYISVLYSALTVCQCFMLCHDIMPTFPTVPCRCQLFSAFSLCQHFIQFPDFVRFLMQCPDITQLCVECRRNISMPALTKLSCRG